MPKMLMEKDRRKAKEKTIEKLGCVSVFIGKDEKEVQNLHLRTTVNEVISALVETEEKDDIRNWVIVESWRGIERPLPPRTRLLKVWNSWKNEQRFVRFCLKKSSSISFRHNQPSKTLRSRRQRPNFIGAQETFIDGPISHHFGPNSHTFGPDEMSAATSESTSGTTTSGDTFGSPSDLSTTTTTTTTTESDSDQNTKHHSQDQRLRQVMAECVERNAKIDKLGRRDKLLKGEIDSIESELKSATLRTQLAEFSEQIHLVEERISSLNNVAAGIQNNIFQEKKMVKPEDSERARAIQTKIEANLYVNLQLAAESDILADELDGLEQSIKARMDLLDLDDVTEIENQILLYVKYRSEYCTANCEDSSNCVDCPDCDASCETQDAHERQRKTSSITTTSTTSGHCSGSSSDQYEPVKNAKFDTNSDYSELPDSDSAVSSMSSSECERAKIDCIKPTTQQDTDKYVRETLV